MSFHFNLGQFISLALLGLSAYEQQDAPNSGGPSLFLNPQVTSEYLQGVATIFQAQQPSVAAANPVPVATPAQANSPIPINGGPPVSTPAAGISANANIQQSAGGQS